MGSNVMSRSMLLATMMSPTDVEKLPMCTVTVSGVSVMRSLVAVTSQERVCGGGKRGRG